MSFSCSRIPFRISHNIQLSCLHCGFLLLFVCLSVYFFCFLIFWHCRILQVHPVYSLPSPRISCLPECLSCNCLSCNPVTLELPWCGRWWGGDILYFSVLVSIFQWTSCLRAVGFTSVAVHTAVVRVSFYTISPIWNQVSEFCPCKVISPGEQAFVIEKVL